MRVVSRRSLGSIAARHKRDLHHMAEDLGRCFRRDDFFRASSVRTKNTSSDGPATPARRFRAVTMKLPNSAWTGLFVSRLDH